MTVTEVITAAKQLDLRERMLIVSELQETLPADDEVVPLSPEWMAEIERRIADADAHPGQGIPWETVHNEALARVMKHVGKRR
jgi:putative addiction module component (TIGR02574 family)